MKHIIVGNGIAGVTAAQTIVRRDPAAEVHLLGAEPYPYYRRPRLWEFIAGQVAAEEVIFRPAAWYADQGIHLYLEADVRTVEPATHRVGLADGSTMTYDRLLLATGAHSFIPPCDGVDQEGVFSLRTLRDAEAIKTYAQGVRSAIVVGGGLLGLETARALATVGLTVTVVEFAAHLLPRQLDREGAEVLQSLLEDQGLRVFTNVATEAVIGDGRGRAQGIRARDGRELTGELVLFSTGIRSNVALAQQAGMAVERGIVVDEYMQTSAEDVFAAGDAAEFAGRVYGIIPAAIEQARVAAANMVAPGSQAYSGTLAATTLKVAGAELTSLGACVLESDGDVSLRHVDPARGHYRKLVLREGRVVGAILLNDSRRTQPVKQLIERGVVVSGDVERLMDDDFDLRNLLSEDR